MDAFLNGLTSIVSAVIDAVVSGATSLFNLLVITDATTHAITGVSVAGWFVVLGLGLSVVGLIMGFFTKLISKKIGK